jgi:hypothetical protein
VAVNTTAQVIANSRTPASVGITVTNPGLADDTPFLYTRANLLADLLHGPLRELLARTPDWTVFNDTTGTPAQDDKIRITMLGGGLAFMQIPPTSNAIVVFAADSLNFSLAKEDEGLVACSLLLELRAVHSNER